MKKEDEIRRLKKQIEELKRDSFYIKNEITFTVITQAIKDREKIIDKLKINENIYKNG